MQSGIIIVVFILVTWLVLVPVIKKVIKFKSEIKTLREEVKDLKDKSIFLQTLDTTSLEKDLISLSAAVPFDKSIPSIFSTLDGISAKAGVTLLTVTLDSPGSIASGSGAKTQKEDKKLGVIIQPLQISIEGNIEQIKEFLLEMNQTKRLLHLVTMSISFEEQNLGHVNLALDSLYKPTLVQIGKPEAKILPLTEEELGILAQIEKFIWYSGEIDKEFIPSLGNGKEDPFSH